MTIIVNVSCSRGRRRPGVVWNNNIIAWRWPTGVPPSARFAIPGNRFSRDIHNPTRDPTRPAGGDEERREIYSIAKSDSRCNTIVACRLSTSVRSFKVIEFHPNRLWTINPMCKQWVESVTEPTNSDSVPFTIATTFNSFGRCHSSVLQWLFPHWPLIPLCPVALAGPPYIRVWLDSRWRTSLFSL